MAEMVDNAEQRALSRARAQVHTLVETLEAIVSRDPEQEVRGIAISTLDAIIAEARGVLRDHPVINQISDVLSADAIAEGG